MKISVFITSYNQKKYLIEAIESVLSQTLKPCQVIIVDDASTDDSQEVIAGYHTRYPGLITPIYHKENTGVARVRIDALNAVTCDYVTYVDGDDRLLPDKLEKEAIALNRNPDAQISFSNNFYMTEDGVHTGVWADNEKPPEGDVFCRTFARDFPRRNLFRMELVNYRVWQEIGFHDPNLRIYEDFDMRIRLTRKFRVVYHDEPLSEIRLHGKGLSKSDPVKHLEALEYIYKKNRVLLRGLSRERRNYIQQRLGEWLAPFARKVAEDALRQDERARATKYLLRAFRYNPAKFNWVWPPACMALFSKEK